MNTFKYLFILSVILNIAQKTSCHKIRLTRDTDSDDFDNEDTRKIDEPESDLSVLENPDKNIDALEAAPVEASEKPYWDATRLSKQYNLLHRKLFFKPKTRPPVIKVKLSSTKPIVKPNIGSVVKRNKLAPTKVPSTTSTTSTTTTTTTTESPSLSLGLMKFANFEEKVATTTEFLSDFMLSAIELTS